MPGWLVFVLLLVGFVVGAGATVVVTVIRRRRQRRLDISFRERNATKAVGEMPDVEELIKTARFGETDEEKARPPSLAVPGPLHSGSKSCVAVSIDGYSALLRSRQFSLSQAEDIQPVYTGEHVILDVEDSMKNDAAMYGEVDTEGGRHASKISRITPVDADAADEQDGVDDDEDPDPETPWIPTTTNKSFLDGTLGDIAPRDCKSGDENGVNASVAASIPKTLPRRITRIGAGVTTHGLDASAADILMNPDGREDVRTSFDPPFEKMARMSVGRGAGAWVGVGLDSAVEASDAVCAADAADVTHVDRLLEVKIQDEIRQSSPVKSPLRNNPFASNLGEDDKELIRASLYSIKP